MDGQTTLTNSMRFLLILLSLAAFSAIGPPEAAAHSWYPNYCCNDQDCMKVDRIEYVPGGMYMIVGEVRVFVPQAMEKQPSQDSDAHVCLMRTQSGRYRVRCVFVPGTT
jgi:hypothetical protein